MPRLNLPAISVASRSRVRPRRTRSGFEVDIDWQRLAGITGLSTHVIMVNRSGANDSQLFGDNCLPFRRSTAPAVNVAVHLVSAYAEETLSTGISIWRAAG